MPEEPTKKEYQEYKDKIEKEFLRSPEEYSREEGGEKEHLPERAGETPQEEVSEEPAQAHPLPPISEEAQEEAKRVKDLPQERQIQALVDLSFQKGLRHSIDTARALKNPYILDAFHDTLVDHLYKELVEKGKLKEV